MRVDTTIQLKEGGGQPQVLFFNLKQKKTRSEDKVNKGTGDFVTDGRLKEKTLKYKDSTTFNNFMQHKSI